MIKRKSVIIIIIFYINLYVLLKIYIFLDEYDTHINMIENKLKLYSEKYNNCKSNITPLQCGHMYEGYKVQKKGIHPENVVVNLTIYKYILIKNNIACSNKDIIIGIPCAPYHDLERMSLRIGYKNYTNCLLLFFTGISKNRKIQTKLYKEIDKFKDIILFNFESQYFNSSLLLVLLINWVNRNCKKYSYLVYHTPDVFFNYHLFNKRYIEKKNVYPVIAQILNHNRVLRSNRSRFYIPYSVYNSSHYPPQPNGPLIAFSYYTIFKLIANIEKIEYSFWMDDVFLAFLISYTRIRFHHLSNVISLYPIQIKTLPNLTYIFRNIIYIHSLPPGAIFYLLKANNQYYSLK